MNLPDMLEAKKRTKNPVDIIEYTLDEKFKGTGYGKNYFIRTYGCQMNEHDTENIKGILESAGYCEVSEMEDADVIILNTCAIRENAHDKVFGFLGAVKHLKSKRPEVIAGLCGCMVQERSVVDEILEKYKWLDFVFGTHNIDSVLKLIEASKENKKSQIEVFSHEGNVLEGLPSKNESKYKAWVNIQLGCDKFCTYCIVPYTRGKQRSREHERIVEEVVSLKRQGYREVTLLGQNVNAYGKDIYEDYNLAQLLRDVSDTGIERVRFVTSHPWDFTDEMIDIIAERENVMPYVHLPLQSGSNRILKLMGRRYTKEEYIELYDKIREKVPGVSITTDIIVGFPGETEEDFEDTMDVVNHCKYDGAFTFIFSPRKGTPAERMEDNTPLKEKEERLYKLNEVVNKYSNERNQEYDGKIVNVLIEGVSEKNSEMLYGYTETMKLVNVKADPFFIGCVIPVRITEVHTWSLDGEMVYEEEHNCDDCMFSCYC